MKSAHALKAPDHPSYKTHRRQLWTQILIPVLIGAAVFLVAPVAAWISALGGTGNVSRWAAISTMWLLIPVMMAGLILLAVLAVAAYLAGKAGEILPRYSYPAQRFAARAAMGTGRAAEMIRRPVLAVRALGSMARARLLRLRERV